MQNTVLQQKNKARLPQETTPQRRNFALSCLEFTALACMGILALEAFFNFAGVGNEEFLEPDKTLGIRHIPGKKVVWRLEGYSDENLSKQGLRDTEHGLAKPEGVYRIALLGDSATEGMQVALKDTYGKQLEALLNRTTQAADKKIEVINFGCSSYSNGQETLQLEQQVAKFHPDLVVMMYNRGDYIENIRDPSTMKAEPRPYFHMDENGQLVQDNTIMEFNKKAFQPDATTDFLRKNSRIYGVMCHTNLALSLNELLYSKLKNSLLKMLPGSKDGWKRVAVPYTIQDPWKVTQTIIERANTDCKSMNSKFMLVCFPNNVNDKEYGRQISSLKDLADADKFSYVDLTPDFVSAKEPKSLFLKYHFSAAGHELAASKVAETFTADSLR